MAETELIAKIGADASGMVKGTKQASAAFGKMRDELGRFSKDASQSFGKPRDALGRFIKDGKTAATESKRNATAIGRAFQTVFPTFDKLAKSAKASAEAMRKGFKTGGVRGAISGLTSSVGGLGTKLTSLLQVGVGAVFNVLKRGAELALRGVVALTKGVVALGIGLAGIGGLAAKQFAEFETAFAQVRTLVDESRVDIGSLDDGVRGLAVQFGKNLLESTNAAYQAISAGVRPAKVVNFLKVAFEGAAAGAASVGEVTDLVSSTLNAFALPVEKATKVSDIFFKTIKVGKTTASELAASIGQIAPITSAAGVSLEEMGGALAALTASGLPTAEAATALKSALVAIAKPSGDAAKALASIGVSAVSLRSEGLEKTMEKIRAATGGALDRIGRFIPNIRGANAAAVLAGKGFGKFQEALKETRNAAGAAAEAFAKTNKTLGVSFGQLRASIQNAFVQVGRQIAPALQVGIVAVSSFIKKVTGEFELLSEAFGSRFGASIREFFDDLRGRSTTSATVLGTALRGVTTAVQFLGSSVSSIAAPLGVAAGLFSGLVDVVKIAANSIRASFGATLFLLLKPLSLVIEGVGKLASILPGEFGKGVKEATSTFGAFADSLGESAQNSAKAVVDGFKGLGEVPQVMEDVERSTLRAGISIRQFGKGASGLAQDLDDLKAKQEENASATKAASAETSSAASKQQDLTQQLLLSSEAAQQATTDTNAMADAQKALGEVVKNAQVALMLATSEAQKMTAAQALVIARAREAGQAFASLETKQQSQLSTMQLLTSEFNRVATEAGRLDLRVGGVDNLQLIKDRIASLSQVLTGSAKAAFQGYVDQLNAGKITSAEFVAETDRFTNAATRLRAATLAVTNVLGGQFKQAAEAAVLQFSKGKISSREFAKSIEDLVGAQKRAALGFGELFRSMAEVSKGFESLTDQAKKAKLALADELRSEVEDLKAAFDDGKITLGQYLDGIKDAGAAASEFTSLTQEQVVAVQRLRESHGDLSDRVLSLSRTLTGEALQSFNTFIDAFRQNRLSADQLGVAIDGVVSEQKRLAKSAKEAEAGLKRAGAATEGLRVSTEGLSSSQRDNAAAAGEATTAQTQYRDSITALGDAIVRANAQQQLQHELLMVGKTSFFDAATGVRLLNSGMTNLFSSTNKLGVAIDENGRKKLQLLSRGLSDGTINVEQFRQAVKSLAREFGVLADEAEKSNARVQSAFAGSSRISAMGGRPGGIQFSRRSSGGSSVFGIKGRVTSSANFQSQELAQLGAQTGLGPKALAQKIRQAGGVGRFTAQQGFAAGGDVLRTGPAKVEAGEFVATNRGLTDLGKLLSAALGKAGAGAGEQVFNQTNNFDIGRSGGFSDDMDELAMKLAPALARVSRLASSRSPVT